MNKQLIMENDLECGFNDKNWPWQNRTLAQRTKETQNHNCKCTFPLCPIAWWCRPANFRPQFESCFWTNVLLDRCTLIQNVSWSSQSKADDSSRNTWLCSVRLWSHCPNTRKHRHISFLAHSASTWIECSICCVLDVTSSTCSSPTWTFCDLCWTQCEHNSMYCSYSHWHLVEGSWCALFDCS